MFILKQEKENIAPDSIKDFEIRDLTISLLYHECHQEHEYQFFILKVTELNESLVKFLTIKKLIDPTAFAP